MLKTVHIQDAVRTWKEKWKAYLSRQPSLSRDYFIFAVVIAVAVMVLAAVFSVSIYFSEQNHKKQHLFQQFLQVERVMQEVLDYTEQLSSLLGKQIIEEGSGNPEFIADLFRKTTLPDVDPRNTFSWSLFDWVNHNNLQVVNTRLGAVKAHPKDMSMRSYTKKTPTSPWTLQMSKPAEGYPSGVWVIPVALGVSDKNGKYMGAVASGISIEKLTRQIEQSLQEDVSFVIIGEDMGNDLGVITQSSKVVFNDNTGDLIKKFTEAQKHLSRDGVFDKAIEFGDTTFLAEKRIARYPYYVLLGYHKSVTFREFLNILLPRLLEFSGMGGFCILLLAFFHRKIIRPIQILSDTADKISKGTLETDVPHCGVKEFDALSQQLEQVVKYIADLHNTREALVVKTAAAEVANKAKSEFLSCMSHELRTPLNAVIAFSEILMGEMFGKLGNEKYKEYIVDIYRSGIHLLGIIDDILDISRAESGTITLKMKCIDITSIIYTCLMDVADKALKGGVTIDVDIDKRLPYIISDEMRLKQIITNLLSNAVKFTPEGGRVRVSAKAVVKDGKVTDYYIAIQDTGIGMNEEDIPRATEKFGQLDSGLNRKFEGTGLGLPLTKKLLEIQHGDLSIESTLNKGTTVTIHFPQDHYEVIPRKKQEHLLELVASQ